MTLGFVVSEDCVLLGMKKRGFGMGYWNGFGGKLKEKESLEEGMKRELHEECGLTALVLNPCAELFFTFENGHSIHGFVFLIPSFSGTESESDEMKPRWFSFSDIPYDSMWEDDRYWLDSVLRGHFIRGRFHFSDTNVMLERNVEVLDAPPVFALDL